MMVTVGVAAENEDRQFRRLAKTRNDERQRFILGFGFWNLTTTSADTQISQS
jgi:hypothetical protein